MIKLNKISDKISARFPKEIRIVREFYFQFLKGRESVFEQEETGERNNARSIDRRK